MITYLSHQSNRLDLPTEMAVSDTDDIVTILQNNSAEYITVMIPGEDRFATSPIGDAYGCLLTTRMIPVLNNMAGFVKKFQYPNVNETLNECGVYKSSLIDLEFLAMAA